MEIIETNELGGKNSRIETAYHLIPCNVLELLSRVLAEGAKKYAPNNWMKVPSEDHYNHMMNHLMKHMQKDCSEDHLSHALCRMVMYTYMELIKI